MTPSDCKPVLLFDVNETLLELSVFQPFFSRVFGDAQALRRWFDQVVIMSSAMTLSGQYADSATIGLAALKMMAEVAQMRLQERDVEEFRKAAASQVTYADVTPALTALRGAGFRMVLSAIIRDKPQTRRFNGMTSFVSSSARSASMTIFTRSSQPELHMSGCPRNWGLRLESSVWFRAMLSTFSELQVPG